MNDGSFLVARVTRDLVGETLEWLALDEPPLEPMDPLDFLGSAEIAAVYDLYRTQYSILRLGLNVLGVYGEVSDGVERVVAGRVPEVPLGVAEQVLGKMLEPHEDGRHYWREITNVGPKTKLLVGRPILE